MINRKDNPVEWALLCTELEEASEHLESLLHDMVKSNEIDETEYSVQLGHISAHLNRAWNARNLKREITEKEWESYSQFPTDLRPVG